MKCQDSATGQAERLEGWRLVAFLFWVSYIVLLFPFFWGFVPFCFFLVWFIRFHFYGHFCFVLCSFCAVWSGLRSGSPWCGTSKTADSKPCSTGKAMKCHRSSRTLKLNKPRSGRADSQSQQHYKSKKQA